ncbi:hypothetical protein V6N13_120822 [Hibiscus sabdariffa]
MCIVEEKQSLFTMEKRVAIVGAGTSGLIACKYILEKGFDPIVFEAEDTIGGVWARTLDSTRLQHPQQVYQFSDFPWPSNVKETYPSHSQVMDYIQSYARHFGISSYIKFNSKVLSIDYVGEAHEEIESWHLWCGTGKPFGSKGNWHITVQDVKSSTIEVYKAEFVILCIGQFNGVPNMPSWPPNQGPQVFSGKVMHIMDYTAMNSSSAEELVRNKRVTVIGSGKSAMDLAAQCANINGTRYPCTMIRRTAPWVCPYNDSICEIGLGLLFLNRISELLNHKPGETFLLGVLATLLSPLIAVTPENFFDRLEEGSIVIKDSQSFGFCREGLVLDEETMPLETDIVIFATGYKAELNFRNIFASPVFQQCIKGSPSALALYRRMIHPRIPRLAVIGYGGTLSHMATCEIRCQWVTKLLEESMELPCVEEMEKDVKLWEDYFKNYAIDKYSDRSCMVMVQLWYNDQLCRDMECEPRRKKGIIAELFEPYLAKDYAGLTAKQS